MKNTFSKFFRSLLLAAPFGFASLSVHAQSIYDFKVAAIDSGEISFSDYKGKKILIVNTASKCGFTPQYEGLQKLYSDNKDSLVIIGFPENNFLWQEPGSDEKINSFCKKKYGVTFPMASKVSVKGKHIHPLFKWLIEQPNPDFTGNIKWNFEKFLFEENGKLIHRYRSNIVPSIIEKDLK